MKKNLFKVASIFTFVLCLITLVGCKKEPEAKVNYSKEPYVISDYLFGYSNKGELTIDAVQVELRDRDSIDLTVLIGIEMDSCDFADTVGVELVDQNGTVIASDSVYLKIEEHDWGYYDYDEIKFICVPDGEFTYTVRFKTE